MSEAPAINWKKGVNHYGGDEEMFKLMIERFEDLTFNQSINQMFHNVIDMDFKSLKTDAQTIKGASSYLAAERCEKVAIELEQSVIKEDENRIIENFLKLMAEAKDLKRYIAKVTQREPDVTDFENYEKEVRKKYLPHVKMELTTSQEKNSQCCSGCNLF